MGVNAVFYHSADTKITVKKMKKKEHKVPKSAMVDCMEMFILNNLSYKQKELYGISKKFCPNVSPKDFSEIQQGIRERSIEDVRIVMEGEEISLSGMKKFSGLNNGVLYWEHELFPDRKFAQKLTDPYMIK